MFTNILFFFLIIYKKKLPINLIYQSDQFLFGDISILIFISVIDQLFDCDVRQRGAILLNNLAEFFYWDVAIGPSML